MILTGKCKEDFEKWILSIGEMRFFAIKPEMRKSCKLALIIEWFDSVGMFVDVQCGRKDLFDWEVCQHINGYKPLASGWKSTRSEATKAGIQEADLIYNEKHK